MLIGFRKITAVLMALMMFLATTSFTVDIHYCGETLVDLAINHKADNCGMDVQEKHKTCSAAFTSKPCCSDKQIMVQGEEDLSSSYKSLKFEQEVFIATFLLSCPKTLAVFDTAPPFF